MFFISWIKRNKLVTLLIIVVAYFIFSKIVPTRINSLSLAPSATRNAMPESVSYDGYGTGGSDAMVSKGMPVPPIYPAPDYAPQTDVAERLVVENSYLSLLVKDVVEARNKIIEFAQGNGGYMVNANVSNPQDAPTGTVTVRVPSAKLEEALNLFRSLSIKVVSENLDGQDVTDQYVDIAARIKTLEQTKTKFEAILAEAREVSDIVNLNQQIISIQSQIDSYKGQQDSLTKNAQLAKLTVYLSTDEIALPYAPSETFRPNVIFKLAVRSLVTHLRGLATFAIWIVVYAVIWVPVLVVSYFLYKRFGQKRTQ